MSEFLKSLEPGSGALLSKEVPEGSKAPNFKGEYVFDREVTFKPGDRFKIAAWGKQTNYGLFIRLTEDSFVKDPNYRKPYQPKPAKEVTYGKDDSDIPF